MRRSRRDEVVSSRLSTRQSRTRSSRWVAKSAIAVAVWLGCCGVARAFPLTWSLNITFKDGGTAAGSFTYDADTSTILDWLISTSGGNTATFPDFTYAPANNTTAFATTYANHTVTGFFFRQTAVVPDRDLRFSPVSELTDAGGVVDIDVVTTPVGVECFDCNPFREISSGVLMATSAVAPALGSPSSMAFQLLAAALAVAGFATANRLRRKTR